MVVPTAWLPPPAEARCTRPTDWVATKLRWNLAVDDRERAALGWARGRAAGPVADPT
ncbi:hypothetical protein ACWGI8_43455 [Streptomyces sp. NPDC054841]